MPAALANGESGASVRSKINQSFTDFSSHDGAGASAHANAVADGAAGFMTGADKTKLDGVAASANNYSHPNHTGDVTSTGDGETVIANAAVTNAKISNRTALSVFGRSANSSGAGADMAAGTDGHVLRRSGTTLGFGTVATAGVTDAAITNAKLANVATATIKGRATAGAGVPEDLTSTQATAILNTFTNSLKGLAPASGGGTTNYLRADGTWAAPAGGGSVTSVDMTVPTGISVSGSPITGAGTLAVTLESGYVIPTQAALDDKVSSSAATTISATKSVLVSADKFISFDSAASDVPKLTTLAELNNSLGLLAPGTALGTTGTVNLDLAALANTDQQITATGNITFTTSNRAAGLRGRLRIAAGASTRTLTWPGWTAFGAALPTSLASGKVLRVAWECTGTTDASVDAVAVESV